MDDKIIKKLTDREFAKKIIGLKTKDEVKKAFEDEDMKISNKQLDELGEKIHEVVEKMSKLSSEELVNVSGGTQWIWGLIDTTPTFGDTVYHALEQPGVAAATIAAGGGVISGLLHLGATFMNHNAPPPPPPPLISKDAMATGVVVLAVLGSGCVITQLVKSGWFEARPKKKKSGSSLSAGGE